MQETQAVISELRADPPGQTEQQQKPVDSSDEDLILFSSINGGFSRSDGNEICTLPDLLRVVQPLCLRLFDGKHLSGRAQIGEGVTYRVSRYIEQNSSRDLVAVKQVKLPMNNLQREEFQRKVRCVLKDIEVMHHSPLKTHPNIVTMYGYGWGLADEGSLPFLVTELSSFGNLREFLRFESLGFTGRERMPHLYRLCCDVASGIYAIHSCGISHGDLKLENVLVFAGGKQAYTAKLSDFGQACLLSPIQARGTKQAYHGTVGYLPPELGFETIDLRKCDSWTLGLLTWEVLQRGKPYVETGNVKSLVAAHESAAVQPAQSINSGSTRETDCSAPFKLDVHLMSLAVEFVETVLKQELEDVIRGSIKAIFRRTLQYDPKLRYGDVSKLPFIHSTFRVGVNNGAPEVKLDLLAGKNTWAYEDFEPRNLVSVPDRVKATVVADAKTAAFQAASGSPQKSKAALYVAQAYAIGYGVEKNITEFLSWTRISAENGSSIAKLILEIVRTQANPRTLLLNSLRELWEQSPAFEYIKNKVGCRCRQEKTNQWDLSLFISADGFNILHCLALFEGLTSTLASEDFILSRKSEIENFTSTQESLSTQTRSGLHMELKDTEKKPKRVNHWLEPVMEKPQELPVPSARKCLANYECCILEVLNQLVASEPGLLYANISKAQPLGPQFPILLRGTPLSFATIFRSHESVRALLNLSLLVNQHSDSRHSEAPDIYDDYHPLQVAVSAHMHDFVDLFWDQALQRYGESTLRAMYINDEEMGANLVSKISYRSSLERLILHGSSSSKACQLTLESLLNHLQKLTSGNRAKAKSEEVSLNSVLNKALKKIVGIGDLEIAKKLAQEIGYDKLKVPFIEASSSKFLRQSIIDTAVMVGTGDAFDSTESERFLDFAIELGPDIQVQFQILCTLISRQNVRQFRRQFQKKINWNDRDSNGKSVLHHVIENNFQIHVPISELVASGARGDLLDEQRCSPLHVAAKKGLSQVFSDLLMAVPDFSALESRSYSIIHCAVESGAPRAVEEILNILSSKGLLQAENDTIMMSRRNMQNRTALHVAASRSDNEIVELLIRYGASVKERDQHQNNALHLAVADVNVGKYIHTIACCTVLLKAGCPAGDLNEDGNAPIHLASRNRRGEAVDQLLRLFAAGSAGGIDIPDSKGRTVLYHASAAGRLDVVKLCCELGASARHADKDNSTPLHACAEERFVYIGGSTHEGVPVMVCIADALLERGADIFAQDGGGRFATDYAAANGKVLLFCHLIKHANAQTQKSGKLRSALSKMLASAWPLAIHGRHWTIVKQLLCRTVDVDMDMSLLEWPNGARLLRYAIQTNDFEILAHFDQVQRRRDRHSDVEPMSLDRFQTDERGLIRVSNSKATTMLNQFSGRIARPRLCFGLPVSWTPDEMKLFEDMAAVSYCCHATRSGGAQSSPLPAISSFARTWEDEIILRYFHHDYQDFARGYFYGYLNSDS